MTRSRRSGSWPQTGSQPAQPGDPSSYGRVPPTQLTRYLAPFFGELRPRRSGCPRSRPTGTESTPRTTRSARRRRQAGRCATRGRATGSARSRTTRSTRPCGRPALVLDDAEDAGWIERNPARARRTRERAAAGAPRRSRRGRVPRPARRGAAARRVPQAGHCGEGACCAGDQPPSAAVPARYIATLGLAGLRVGELCGLDNRGIDLAKARLHITDAKTAAGVRVIDIHPRLLASWPPTAPAGRTPSRTIPPSPTRAATRRTRSNVLTHVIHPVLARADELRTQRDRSPIRVRLTPHTFRRS